MKSHKRATTKNPTATMRNCQTSDAKTFLSATPGGSPSTQRVSYIRGASAVIGLPRPKAQSFQKGGSKILGAHTRVYSGHSIV
jgi:hypothetical protein